MATTQTAHPLESRGIRANGHQTYAVELTGKQWYDLLGLLDQVALDSTAYLRVREAVLQAEHIREQLTLQGF